MIGVPVQVINGEVETKLPTVEGWVPAGIVVKMVLVAVLITDTSLLAEPVTYNLLPSTF